MKLPAVNDRVRVYVPGFEGELSSRVEDVREGSVAIGFPSDGQTTHALPPGTDLRLEWLTSRGLVSFPARVGGRASLNVPVLLVDPTGAAVITQRREFVRADEVVPIVLRTQGAEPVVGSTLDLSGGGAQVHVPAALDPGSYVRARLELPDGPVDAVARVVRQNGEIAALAFVQIEPPDRERIISLVFDSHRRAHAFVRRS